MVSPAVSPALKPAERNPVPATQTVPKPLDLVLSMLPAKQLASVREVLATHEQLPSPPCLDLLAQFSMQHNTEKVDYDSTLDLDDALRRLPDLYSFGLLILSAADFTVENNEDLISVVGPEHFVSLDITVNVTC